MRAFFPSICIADTYIMLLNINILSLVAEVLQITEPTQSCWPKVRLYIAEISIGVCLRAVFSIENKFSEEKQKQLGFHSITIEIALLFVNDWINQNFGGVSSAFSPISSICYGKAPASWEITHFIVKKYSLQI